MLARIERVQQRRHGALDAGGRQMQVVAGVRIDLIAIVQALIIVFVAAPLLMRTVFPWAFRRRRAAAGTG